MLLVVFQHKRPFCRAHNVYRYWYNGIERAKDLLLDIDTKYCVNDRVSSTIKLLKVPEYIAYTKLGLSWVASLKLN